MSKYIGNPLQIRGAEQYVLQNGRGDGMHFLYVRNGKGLEMWISLDRAGDVSRISYKGDNMGFFSACGYVAPQYFDGKGTGFLKSFTAGFFTTCGLTAVGSPCTDDGEELGLHGTITSIPAELYSIEETETELVIKLKVKDTTVFARKLVMDRVYTVSYLDNTFTVCDTVTNHAEKTSPYMILYHCNMGYPLLSENSIVKIPNNNVVARNENAEKFIDTALNIETPVSDFTERCYFYDVKENGGIAKVGIFNQDINKGLVMSYDKQSLPCFTEWKKLQNTEYVLGLEPGNCIPDGREAARKNGTLKFLEPKQSATTTVTFSFTDDKAFFEEKLK